LKATLYDGLGPDFWSNAPDYKQTGGKVREIFPDLGRVTKIHDRPDCQSE
jgi:hypothetical protein